MSSNTSRLLAGLGTVTAIGAIIALAVSLFRGSWAETEPVTVISDRAGLVMNPDARVKLHGAEVGRVESIEARPDGTASLRLAIDRERMQLIPDNVGVDITSSTVFGAKFVELVPPPEPSSQTLRAGQVIQGQHVTVEINTIFQQLVAVLDKIDPAKLNETLGALSSALSGRGEKFGQAMSDLDALLAKLDPSLPNLSHDIAVAPDVLNAYADASLDLVSTVSNSTRIGDTVVAKQNDLDALLVSAIGLADIGNDVVSSNRQGITDVLHLLAPTTDLTNQYHQGLNCGLAGLAPLAKGPPTPVPGVLLLDSFVLGRERYRYPQNLPKVAATGGPQCAGLPDVGYEKRAPFVVSDIGADQAQYGNQGILLNSDALKQWLFGPIDGPPRNTTQIGQPG
jgi:virulence factor Mce-like protein